MRARVLSVLLLCVAVAMLGACGDDSNDKPTIKVSAAASLKDAFEAYAKDFDAANVSYSFAGSDELAAQIKAGARPDVYAAANTKLPDELYSDGLVEKPVPFATNTLVIAVPADAKDKVKSLDDLAQPGVDDRRRQRDRPGRLLHAQGPREAATRSRAGHPGQHQVERAGRCRGGGEGLAGSGGCGFVYITDVKGASGKLSSVSIPTDLQPTVVYAAAVVKDTKHHDQAPSSSRASRAAPERTPCAPRASGHRRRADAGPGEGVLFRALLIVALALVVGFLFLPVLAIFVDVGLGELISSIGDPVAVDALKLSLLTTGIALGIILLVGTPAAWFLGRREFRGRAAILTVIELPLVLPPAAAGIGLLAALGPSGILGDELNASGSCSRSARRAWWSRSSSSRAPSSYARRRRPSAPSTSRYWRRPARWGPRRRAPSPASRFRSPFPRSAPARRSPGVAPWANSAPP